MSQDMTWWQRLKKALEPLPPCAECGLDWSDTDHQSWDPGWPGMPVGKIPVNHWYVHPEEGNE